MDRIECQWCRSQNPPERHQLHDLRGAARRARTWSATPAGARRPRLRDMTEFQFSTSTCQVEGELVPVAEVNLGAGDAVFFEHHVMLWKDEAHPAVGDEHRRRHEALARRHAAHHLGRPRPGPGRVLARLARRAARAAAAPGHGAGRARARVPGRLAQHQYSFVRIKGLANILHGGGGMYMDRFVTAGAPGLLLLHGYGNIFERYLRPGREDPGRAGRLPVQGLVGRDERGADAAQDRHDAPRHVPGRNDRTRAGSASSRCTSTTTPSERSDDAPLSTSAGTAGSTATRPGGRACAAARRSTCGRVGQRLGLAEAAADRRHGPDPVRPVLLPDRGHRGAGRRVRARPVRLDLLLPPQPAVGRPVGAADQLAPGAAAGTG